MADEIIRDPEHGYLRLNPVPSQEELDEYYRNQYFSKIAEGGRAQEMGRQLRGGEEARAEIEWLEQTLYPDICHVLEKHTDGRWLLDIGSGAGMFLRFMDGRGWLVHGVEPSKEEDRVALDQKISVFHMSLETFDQHTHHSHAYNAITLLNVLEHVSDPYKMLKIVGDMLAPGGIVCIRVPNDFSVLQLCVDEKKVGKPKWWVTAPDHINYFDFQSLEKLLQSVGLRVVHTTTDFPMEVFLLMGDDYTADPDVGRKCHERRKKFEMSLSDERRRKFYERLAQGGTGRSCIVFAVKAEGIPQYD